MCSFVKQKANKPWVWIAMGRQTRQIIALHIGDHRRGSAKHWRANLPSVYRMQAMLYLDQYEAYKCVIPAEHRKAITKNPVKPSTFHLPFHPCQHRTITCVTLPGNLVF